jgi:hypothetical protein
MNPNEIYKRIISSIMPIRKSNTRNKRAFEIHIAKTRIGIPIEDTYNQYTSGRHCVLDIVRLCKRGYLWPGLFGFDTKQWTFNDFKLNWTFFGFHMGKLMTHRRLRRKFIKSLRKDKKIFIEDLPIMGLVIAGYSDFGALSSEDQNSGYPITWTPKSMAIDKDGWLFYIINTGTFKFFIRIFAILASIATIIGLIITFKKN